MVGGGSQGGGAQAAPLGPRRQPGEIPLCVDLDGTLVRSDMLVESAFILVKRNPTHLFLILLWLLRGRAYLKARIGCAVDVSSVPYEPALIELLRAEHERGRQIALVTAADRSTADQVASHLGIFTEVLASDGATNLKGKTKARELIRRYGAGNFDYVGSDSSDVPIWRQCRQAIVVNARDSLLESLQRQQVRVAQRIKTRTPTSIPAVLRAMRAHQWVKNVLVFAPLIASHRLFYPFLIAKCLLAWAAFSLVSSGTYIVNDLMDLESDRKHPRKRARPFAAGDIPIKSGLLIAPICCLAGFSIGLTIGWPFTLFMVIYLIVTLLYSFRLKHMPMLDVLVLAMLYTLRVMAGGPAANVTISHWLLGISIFSFLSLALVKRCSELHAAHLASRGVSVGRGYVIGDMQLLATFGSASGYVAALVMALYVSSPDVVRLYSHPQWLWLMCPLLLYWISRIWLLTQRGSVGDDPIVFALKDRVSNIVALLAGAVVVLAI